MKPTDSKFTVSAVGKTQGLLLLFLALFSFSALATEGENNSTDALLRKTKTSERTFNPSDFFMLWQNIGDRAGFEIGNGKKIVKNLAGKYLFKMYEKWEVGIQGKFTEVISPLYEGIPRGRLQVNVLQSSSIASVNDLYNAHTGAEWTPVVLGQLEGVQRDHKLSNGVHQVEVHLFRAPGEIIVLNMDGSPGSKELTAFDKIQTALTTFRSLEGK